MSYIDKIVLNGNTYNIGKSIAKFDESSSLTLKDVADLYDAGTRTIDTNLSEYGTITNYSIILSGYINYTMSENTEVYTICGIGGLVSVDEGTSEINFNAYGIAVAFGSPDMQFNNCVTLRSFNDIVEFPKSVTLEDNDGIKCTISNSGSSIYFTNSSSTSIPVTFKSNASNSTINVDDPIQPNNIANKQYVDNAIANVGVPEDLETRIATLESQISTLNTFMNKYNSMLQVIYNG